MKKPGKETKKKFTVMIPKSLEKSVAHEAVELEVDKSTIHRWGVKAGLYLWSNIGKTEAREAIAIFFENEDRGLDFGHICLLAAANDYSHRFPQLKDDFDHLIAKVRALREEEEKEGKGSES